MTVTRKILAGVAVLVVIQVVVYWIRAGYTMEEIEPPKRDLTQFPMQLGPWVGEDVEPNSDINVYLGALESLDRKYKDPAGHQVLLHSVWTEDYVKIHFPEVCYQGAGWNITDSRPVSLKLRNGSTVTTKLLTVERENARAFVLFWFQFGDEIYVDRVQHAELRRKLCWFKKRWPPLVKVMLQTSANNAVEAESTLRDFAGLTYGWLNPAENAVAPVNTQP